MDRWPKLFLLENNKNCSISDRIERTGPVCALAAGWNAWPTTVEEISEMQDLSYLLASVSFAGSKDVWLWDEDSNHVFTVANFKRNLSINNNNRSPTLFKWESWVPLKINIHMWRLEMDRLPTRLALQRRHILLPNTSCSLCEVADESCGHIFVSCGFAVEVWRRIKTWCKLSFGRIMDIEDLLTFYRHVQGPKWANKIIKGIVMTTCWAIWIVRNKKVFENSAPKVADVVASVKSLSFLWLKSRSRFNSIMWKDWVMYPLYML
ncbi:RNA-directed DNA polymerase, eukaryota, Reverse transcriptase zinc-binding domain protein [Artemisia annua]|nr:RNA-directed DNA polymerase, eukaryota, Reverse transcriptase zinc-binding domain protein [Artemisia annua]